MRSRLAMLRTEGRANKMENSTTTDILLIEPDHKTGLGFFPWGILSVGSYLKEKGFSVRLVPGTYYSEQEFEQQFNEWVPQAKVVGFTCFTTDTATVKRLIDRIKLQYPSKIIVVGGPHAILLPKSTLEYSNIDVVVPGLGELPMADLMEQIVSGNNDYSKVRGIGYRTAGGLNFTAPVQEIPEYRTDFSLLPKRKLVKMHEYLEYVSGRGCSFTCTFCYNAVCGHKWKGQSATRMVEELREIVAQFDPKEIMFQDDNFFHSKDRIIEFIKLYKENNFTFRWMANCRASYFTKNYINEEMLQSLEQINCSQIRFGFESGSQRVLDFLRKGVKLTSMYRVVELLAKSKIQGNYSFLIGVPTETQDEYVSTLSLIWKIIKTDPNAYLIGPQYYRMYPGGELYSHIIENYDFVEPKAFEDWAEAVEGDYFGLSKNFDYPWVRDANLVRYADIMVLLARKPLSELVRSPLKAPALVFALLASLRMRMRWYTAMWDMKLASYLFRQYAEKIGKPKMLKN